jgi:hypothetical protein
MDDRPAGQLSGEQPRQIPVPPGLKLINKDIDHPNRIVLIDPVFQAFGKQGALPAIRALNEALHPTLRRSQESALRESHEARRFHNQVNHVILDRGYSSRHVRCSPKATISLHGSETTLWWSRG